MKNKSNAILRDALNKHHVCIWQVARDILYVSEPTIYRMLRNELPEKEQLRLAALIEEYAAKGGARA